MVSRMSLVVCCLVFYPTVAVSQDAIELNSLSLSEFMDLEEELGNMDITVAAGKENKLSARESPGVVTVMTQRDIKATGAQNILQLLRFVPGYDIGSGNLGFQGLIARGNSATEGKVLFNINGVPVNEAGYAYFAMRPSLDHIERIEIIRGPGSVLYGGAAELGVINIITKDMRDSREVSVGTDRINNSSGYRSVSLAAGRGSEEEDDWDVNVFVHHRISAATEGAYMPGGVDESYETAVYNNAEDFHKRENLELLINGQKSNFYYDFIFSETRSGVPISVYDTGWGDATFRDEHANLDYDAAIARVGFREDQLGNTVIDASVLYGRYDSDRSTGSYTQRYPSWFYNVPVERLNIDLNMNHESVAWDRLTVDAGLGFYQDSATISARMFDAFRDVYGFVNPEGTVSFDTVYLFLQAFVDWDNYNVTLGVRSEDHQQYGRVTVPRAALTYLRDALHIKLLAARSFKEPTILNMVLTDDLGADLKPEKNKNYELELGYRFVNNSQLTLNLFDNALTDVLVYNPNNGKYINSNEFDTRGFEVIYRWLGARGFAAINLSRHWLADAAGPSSNDYYGVYPAEIDFETSIDRLLGSAEKQVAIYGEYKITDQLSVNPALIYFGERYSMVAREEFYAAYFQQIPSDIVINLFVHYEDLFVEGFSAALGVTNLNDGDNLVTSLDYSDEVGHRPGIGRRVDLRLKYTF